MSTVPTLHPHERARQDTLRSPPVHPTNGYDVMNNAMGIVGDQLQQRVPRRESRPPASLAAVVALFLSGLALLLVVVLMALQIGHMLTKDTGLEGRMAAIEARMERIENLLMAQAARGG